MEPPCKGPSWEAVYSEIPEEGGGAKQKCGLFGKLRGARSNTGTTLAAGFEGARHVPTKWGWWVVGGNITEGLAVPHLVCFADFELFCPVTPGYGLNNHTFVK